MSALADTALRLFVQVHDAVYQRSKGWVGHRIPGAPNSLLLHTVGAKTGLLRTNSCPTIPTTSGCGESSTPTTPIATTPTRPAPTGRSRSSG